MIEIIIKRLCIIGLAPTHVAFKDQGGITAVDFNVGKSDRSGFKVTGKRKKVCFFHLFLLNLHYFGNLEITTGVNWMALRNNQWNAMWNSQVDCFVTLASILV